MIQNDLLDTREFLAMAPAVMETSAMSTLRTAKDVRVMYAGYELQKASFLGEYKAFIHASVCDGFVSFVGDVPCHEVNSMPVRLVALLDNPCLCIFIHLYIGLCTFFGGDLELICVLIE